MNLITKQEVAKYFQISHTAALERYIAEAQSLDLRPLLGDAFYYHLIENQLDEKYQDLIFGTTYIAGSTTIIFEGLQQCLAYFAYSRYILRNNMVDTPFGLVTKIHQDAQPKSDTDKRQIAKEIRQDAYVFFNDVVKYLNTFSADFPLFKKTRNTTPQNQNIRFDVL